MKKSTSVIDKQNTHQESLAKSISEINNLISENIELNKNISEEIRVLSKTIEMLIKTVRQSRRQLYEINIWPGFVDILGTILIVLFYCFNFYYHTNLF